MCVAGAVTAVRSLTVAVRNSDSGSRDGAVPHGCADGHFHDRRDRGALPVDSIAVELSTRRQICQLVAGVLVSDDDFADVEKRFLQRIYARLELPPDEWESVQPTPVGAATAALRQLPVETHTKVAALLVEAVVADGVVEPRERVYLLVAAAAMGIDAVVMEQRLASRLQTLAERGPMSMP